MSKIVAEIDIKQGNVSDAVKGVAQKLENAFGPIKRNQAAFSRLGNALAPVTGIAMGVASGLAVVGGAALVAGGAMGVGVKNALDLGGRLSDLEARTGIAAGGLMRLEQAFRNNGLQAEQVGPSINRMQKAIDAASQGSDEAVETLTRLGLSVQDLAGLSPEQQFQKFSAAIGGVQDPAQRAALAMKIFGKSGGEMLALFGNASAFTDAAAEVGSQAEIMNRNAALFDDISDKMALVGLKVQGFFVGIADYVAPVIKPLLDWFASQDLAAQGQAFGLAIATAITMLTDGTIGSTLLLMAQNAGMAFNNLLIGGINSALQMIAQIPGLGAVGDLKIPELDRTEVEAKIAANVTGAMTKVFDARENADKMAKKDKTGAGEGEGGGSELAGGPKGSGIKQLFSTSMGLFVKDPVLAETRRGNDILTKIERGIANLKQAPGVPGAGGLRFS